MDPPIGISIVSTLLVVLQFKGVTFKHGHWKNARKLNRHPLYDYIVFPVLLTTIALKQEHKEKRRPNPIRSLMVKCFNAEFAKENREGVKKTHFSLSRASIFSVCDDT